MSGRGRKRPVSVNENSLVIKAFCGYQTELDTKHDRHERIVKLSRDITIESKRVIFLLQRCAGDDSEGRQAILQQALTKLKEIQHTKFLQLAMELEGQDPFQFIRAYSPAAFAELQHQYGMYLVSHVEDKHMTAGEFEDVSKVEKFEISEEEYSKRADSVRAFKERNRIGRFNEEAQKKKPEEQQKKEEEEKEKAASMKVGDRCEVRVPGQPARRGAVRYVGTTDFKPGVWVGIQYDEPHGKNDGSVAGKRYFECKPKYGGFVKPSAVEVGDFPEEDLGFDEDEM